MSQNECTGCYLLLPKDTNGVHWEDGWDGFYKTSRPVMMCLYNKKKEDERNQDRSSSAKGS